MRGVLAMADEVAVDAAVHALTAIERAICDVIGRSIGRDENYFDAGLTSLGLVRLHRASTRELADPFPVTVMFAYPNLRALHRYLVEGETTPSAPERAGRASRLRGIGSARRELRQRIRTESGRP
jgi:hypothetical protein